MARDVVAADLQHELEPGRGDERRRRRLPLEEGVGGGGGPVQDAHDVLGRPSREGQDLADGGHEAGGEIAGVDGVLATQVAPVSASAKVLSVKVPPTSMARVPRLPRCVLMTGRDR